MGKAGINKLGISFMIAGVWGFWRIGTSGGGRGNAGLFSFDYHHVKKAPFVPKGEFWGGMVKAPYYDKSITMGYIRKKDMWDRFIYFIKNILPTAERSGVKICIHPSDPPAPELRGIERILNCISDFKDMIEIFPSEYLGINFCQGTFTEMQEIGSKNIFDIIRYFGKKRKIFYVHFRNVMGSFPKYDEVFIDEGDVDMIKALKVYKNIGFNGMLVIDHTPLVTASKNPWFTGAAYASGYIKAALQALNIDSI
jgi:mannonate dehydratase